MPATNEMMCDAENPCCCYQLEAEPLMSNGQLLNFDVRSKDVDWSEYVRPLERRGKRVYLNDKFKFVGDHRETGDNRQVLLCHDMMGNYLDDKHYHKARKYDAYRFYHWAAIDYFCYFSHNYITIPPCGWINAAHKHGVRVLGTYIVEGEHGSKLLHEVLKSKEMVHRVANAMAKICRHYCFEGYLVNIECSVKPESVENLLYLRDCLMDTVKDNCLFWYDSVIETGALIWQNEINVRNEKFFENTKGMLINYSWTEESLENTKNTCERLNIPDNRAFFGLDVFGRGQIAQFHSHITVERIFNTRFSWAIFAPAWTWESLIEHGYNIKQPVGSDEVNDAFLIRNEKWWASIWRYLPTHEIDNMPVYSDFCLGSGKRSYLHGQPYKAQEVPLGKVVTGATLVATATGAALAAGVSGATIAAGATGAVVAAGAASAAVVAGASGIAGAEDKKNMGTSAAVAGATLAMGTAGLAVMANMAHMARASITAGMAGAAIAAGAAGATSFTTAMSFFNLSRQSLQPSVPLYNTAERYYEDAFNGGSCLRFMGSKETIRIFLTNICLEKKGLVFAYAYKVLSANSQFECVLRIKLGNMQREVYVSLGGFVSANTSLSEAVLRDRLILSPFHPKYYNILTPEMQCPHIPTDMIYSSHSQNGWRTRYYIMTFESTCNIMDVGVLFTNNSADDDTAFLGAVYMNDFEASRFNFPNDSNVGNINNEGKVLETGFQHSPYRFDSSPLRSKYMTTSFM